MKKNIYASALLLFVLGCSNSDLSVGTDSMQTENSNVNVLTSAIVSDPSLDPYSIENMNKAMRKSVLAKSSVMDSTEVESMELKPNYLYVRFLVSGKDEFAELKSRDTTVVYFKHPLDYKPIKKPAVYVDPTLPDSVRPYFAAVPVDFDFGSTKYDVIKELFLVEPLDEDDDEERDSISAARSVLKKASSGNPVAEKLNDLGVSLQEIEWTSLQMTGNVGEREPSLSQAPVLEKKNTFAWSLLGTGKRYKGHLEFEDDILHAQPLVGVRVTGGYSYYWKETHTNENGDFKIPEKWNFSIDYEANFDSDDFLLEDGHSFYGEDLEIENNNKKKDWNEKFTGDKAKWCIVWTAAYQYWYGNNFGLKRPRQNTATNFSLDIEVYYKNKKDYKNNIPTSGPFIGCGAGESNGRYSYNLGGLEEICISTYGRSSKEIYTTVIHEVGHTSHYWNTSQSLSKFFDLPEDFRNTYTRGVENFFAEKRYGVPGQTYHSNVYTGIIEDLQDSDAFYKPKGDGYVVVKGDAVRGFNIVDLEKAVFATSSLTELKKYLKKHYPSNAGGRVYTNQAMDDLFNYWMK
ncbi:hypothetical protein [uncultured Fibrobacter sp.]|uniref:hypothetical protein n=1 Tax=uncultured Fibrobacter sp. TaxID=261512 RepID=UPI0025FEB049|nr:hypothetical protein [uncultured Fibrobacter sp.]